MGLPRLTFKATWPGQISLHILVPVSKEMLPKACLLSLNKIKKVRRRKGKGEREIECLGQSPNSD